MYLRREREGGMDFLMHGQSVAAALKRHVWIAMATVRDTGTQLGISPTLGLASEKEK